MTTAPSRAIMLFGTEQAVARPKTLRAGPLTVELENGNLRYVRYRGVEVLRAIAFLVRDRNWATYGPVIENLKVGQGPDDFAVSYEATCKDASQELRYRAAITGRADGTLRFEADGRALTDFVANRAGFVVLHPLEGVAGEPVEVTHTDGQVEQASFPRLISPSQPLFDIRALAHEVMPGVRATCTMEGDAYEMEDQRNWTDASYKTYIRPLAKPRPYTVRGGEAIRQSVSLTFRGAPSVRGRHGGARRQHHDRRADGPADAAAGLVGAAGGSRAIDRRRRADQGPRAQSAGRSARPARSVGCRRAGSSAGAGRGRGRAGRARDRAAE